MDMDNAKYMIPFLPPLEEYMEVIEKIWENKRLTNNGSLLIQLEHILKDYFGANNIVLYCNGHSALEESLRALNISGEVITSPLSFVSTSNAIVRAGCKPVFCDIREDNLTLDPSKIENHISKETQAIMPVHVYGHICDMETIGEIAQKHDLKVIYDSAHTFGVKKLNDNIYHYGDINIVSFHATKIFHTIEGGAIVTDNDTVYKKLERNRNFGINDNGECVEYGGNGKMSEFHAAMGLCNIKYIDEQIEKHRTIAKKYQALLSGISGLRVMEEEKEIQNSYPYFYIIFEQGEIMRKRVFDELIKKGYLCKLYFSPIIPQMKIFKSFGKESLLPVAEKVGQGILCLPIHSELKEQQVEDIVSIIKKEMR